MQHGDVLLDLWMDLYPRLAVAASKGPLQQVLLLREETYLDAGGAHCRLVWLVSRHSCGASLLLSQQRLLQLLIQDEVKVVYELSAFCHSLTQPPQSIFSCIPACHSTPLLSAHIQLILVLLGCILCDKLLGFQLLSTVARSPSFHVVIPLINCSKSEHCEGYGLATSLGRRPLQEAGLLKRDRGGARIACAQQEQNIVCCFAVIFTGWGQQYHTEHL